MGRIETLAQLAETVLWRYTWTTLVLMVSVAAGSIVIGTLTA
ncbi:ferric iron ABC transporter, permease protein [Rhodobacteraceae bacterium HTCC2083]|nr:ferric iron ABC transporter, permease protein [Rhodobacteraceae bacterium HTCC2083]